jgi:hypothetical protein
MSDAVMDAIEREDAATQKLKAELVAERDSCAKRGLHFVLPGDPELNCEKETCGGPQ